MRRPCEGAKTDCTLNHLKQILIRDVYPPFLCNNFSFKVKFNYGVSEFSLPSPPHGFVPVIPAITIIIRRVLNREEFFDFRFCHSFGD